MNIKLINEELFIEITASQYYEETKNIPEIEKTELFLVEPIKNGQPDKKNNYYKKIADNEQKNVLLNYEIYNQLLEENNQSVQINKNLNTIKIILYIFIALTIIETIIGLLFWH